MNREIKFRGKSFDTLEWEYGDLIHAGKDRDIILIEGIDGITSMCRADTVGQYTGLKDKNGVEIYEGDILEDKKGCTCGIVEWKTHGFDLGVRHMDCYGNIVCEVVGNIHDNPELKERTK